MQHPVSFHGRVRPSGGDLPPAQRPIWPGTLGPVGSSPNRRPHSVRRTTSLDILWPHGARGPLVLRGTGRDLVTEVEPGHTAVVGQARLEVEIDMPALRVASADLDPDVGGVASWLADHSAHFRTRRELDLAHPDFVTAGSLAALLVDEIPAAALISGSSLIRSGLVQRAPGEQGVAPGVCAGWIKGGSMHLGLSSRPFLGEGPPAPVLTRPDDPLAWHDEGDLPVAGMRRRRRIDVMPDDDAQAPIVVDVYFRDSFVEPDGVETVVHEYGIDLTVEPGTRRVLSIAASAHVLPGPECPSAAASAHRIAGMSIDEIRGHVRDQFRGTSTCTHLNDALRSIGDIGALLPHLA